jgi:hypothetical protein
MTKIGFKLTISPFDYQIFTAPLTEPLRVDYLKALATLNIRLLRALSHC